MAGITCCRNCKNRSIGCHSTCEVYIQQAEEYHALKAKADKRKYVHGYLYQQRTERVIKANKRKRH